MIRSTSQKESLMRNKKSTLRAAREANSNMKEDQYDEELMDKPRIETVSGNHNE